jgi:hypothetical protein
MVIVPAGLIEESQGNRRPYTEHLSKKAKATLPIPPAPKSESPDLHFLSLSFLPIIYCLALTLLRLLALLQATLKEKLLLLRGLGSETWYVT